MKKALQEKCNLLVENSLYFRKKFKWDYSCLHNVAAASMTLNGAYADEKKLKEQLSEIKRKTGVFSDFANYLRLPGMAKMYVSRYPEQYLKNALEIYKRVDGSRLATTSRMIAAMILSEYADGSYLEQLVERTNTIYKLMKKEHSVLTDSTMLPSAAFLAIATSDEEAAVNRAEEALKILSEYFGKKRSTYRLACLISLSEGNHQNNCDQAVEIHKNLKLYGHPIGKGNEMIVIGSLVGHGVDFRSIVEAAIDVDEFLTDKKGYSNFAIGAKTRMDIAFLLVLAQCEEDYSMSVSMLEENQTERSLMLNAGLFVCIQNAVETAVASTAAACS